MASWHGFDTFADFLKALGVLGALLGPGMWALLTHALDEVYAPVTIVQQVQKNGATAEAVKTKLGSVEEVVVALRVDGINTRIQNLQKAICAAEEGTPAKQFYAHELVEEREKYRKLTKEPAIVPTCESVR